MPFKTIGSFVTDLNHSMSSHVSTCPKVAAQVKIAAAGSSSGGLASKERKTGSVK